MIGNLNGPWLLCVALVLLTIAVARVRPRTGVAAHDLWVVALLTVVAIAARLVFGLWGPLHVNGQGPLWIRGAVDSAALANYGPGYFELLNWTTRIGLRADSAVFAANALLSGVGPALLYAVARLAGVARGGALVAAAVLAVDAVTARTAASELYIFPIITLVLAVQLALIVFARARFQRDDLAAGVALVAGGLLGASVARIHLLGVLPLALSPLVVLGAARPAGWSARLSLAVQSGLAIALAVLLSSGAMIVRAWSESPVTGQSAFSGFGPWNAFFLIALCAAAWSVRRHAQPPWLILIAIGSWVLLSMVQASFRLHPFQEQFYSRLCWPGLLLGLSPLVPKRLQGSATTLAVALGLSAVAQIPALSYLGTKTTEQHEHEFLRQVLPGMASNCTLAAVTRADKRVWAVPSYLMSSRSALEVGDAATLRNAINSNACLVYVRSSLCSSAEGRPLCDAVEHDVPLERVTSTRLPAAPSYLALPYDRPEVEVVVFRALGQGVPTARRDGRVSDGAPITPEFAQSLFDRVRALHEPDGCRLVSFDTSRFRIAVGLQTAAGEKHAFDLATARLGSGGRSAGGWALAVPPELDRDCAATLAAIERILGVTAAPQRTVELGFMRSTYDLLAALFVVLCAGTVFVLYREVWRQQPAASWLVALAFVWIVALLLRLTLSPRTFLHEYYHIAETVPAYLTGAIAPLYGKAGPAVFRLVSAAFGGETNVQIIFLTNAVLASLAIPALALFDLALVRSWPRALAVAVLLCVLPLHLRWSAAEDLYVMALTLGLWALGLFALYLQSRRLVDALLAALALALAMQVRPEMLVFPGVVAALVLCVQPRAWRVLITWRSLLALGMLTALLIPRFLELGQALQAGAPARDVPDPWRYVTRLVLLQPEVTPPVYWLILSAGLISGVRRAPGLTLWALLTFVGYTLSALTIFDNPPYNLRSQLLPTSILMLVGGGVASIWMQWWGDRRRMAIGLGAGVLAAFAAFVVIRSHAFVTELRDQQLEWAFLERTVPSLPDGGLLLAAADVGGRNLNAFPAFLLENAGKQYELVDVHRAVRGEVGWPDPGSDVLYYQGMHCYFSFALDEAVDPMTAACAAVHTRYVLEPLVVESLDTEGYSLLRYATGPYRIGFFRVTALRSS